jgi:hypothetical protein
MHSPTDLLEESITLLHIVGATCGDHIGPFVATAAAAWYDVVNRVRVFEAVSAAIAIA